MPLEGELRAIVERRRAARQYTDLAGNVALSLYVFHRGNGEPIRDSQDVGDGLQSGRRLGAALP